MQKDTPEDLELTLKKRARRRLVGALALVLFMVIVLPMILKDRSNTEPVDDITITLSNQDAQSKALPEASDFDSSVISSEISPQDNQPALNEPSLNEPVQQAAEQAPINDNVSDSEAATVEPESAASKIELKKPAETKPQASKPEANKSTTGAKFYVQIGVFSDEGNVKQLQAKLSDLGYKSQTEKIDTAKGKKIRLRTQLLGERNEAAIALQNIKDAGLTGMVVSQ